MVHASTILMLERLSELTRQGKLSWTLNEDQSIAYHVEDNFVQITPKPHSMSIINKRFANALETTTAQDLQNSTLPNGENAYEALTQMYSAGVNVGIRLSINEHVSDPCDGPKFFVCYRREDTRHIAGRVHDKLLTKWAPESIFLDTNSVPLGVDFRVFTKEVLTTCSHMLVLVGEKFVGESLVRPRIQDQNDLVRTEIEMAFSLGITVIPVTIDDARMPTPEVLPSEIQSFSFLNAAKLDSGSDFHIHMDRIMGALERKGPNHEHSMTY